MTRILLIGSNRDPHVTVLAEHISELGATAAIIDATAVNNSIVFRFARSRRSEARLVLPSGEDLDCTGFGAVWHRLKPVIPLPSWGPLEASAAQFAQGEWRTVLRSLNLLLDKSCWINSVESQSIISSKLRQLDLAASIGFAIPDTVVTNDPNLVLDMFSRHRRIIYKALNGFVFPDQTGILTTEFTKEDVCGNFESIRRAPGIYQQFVEKNYELRVTIVGTQVFPALIRTPTTGAGSIDWRHAHFDDIFERCSLDSQVSEKLLAFQVQTGLKYGAYDLIVDHEGRYFFLECNPAGQFLWLENSLGLPITRTIAAELRNLAVR